MIGVSAIRRRRSLGLAPLAPLPAALAHLLALLGSHAFEEGAALLGRHVAHALSARAARRARGGSTGRGCRLPLWRLTGRLSRVRGDRCLSWRLGRTLSRRGDLGRRPL